MYIFDISISNKKRYFKNIHNHLHYIFIHAIHWLDDYPKNSSLEKIFKYPKDMFSHLQSSKILSEKIAEKINKLN